MKFCLRITRNWKIFVIYISGDALVKYFPQWLFIILIDTLCCQVKQVIFFISGEVTILQNINFESLWDLHMFYGTC